jgi:hypothetical protein
MIHSGFFSPPESAGNEFYARMVAVSIFAFRDVNAAALKLLAERFQLTVHIPWFAEKLDELNRVTALVIVDQKLLALGEPRRVKLSLTGWKD